VPLLYLLRHAKSSWDEPSLADRDRPLAPRGRKAASALAHHIKKEKIAPALVLSSPARRAVDTLELVAPALGPQAQTQIEEALYGAGVEDLLRRLRNIPPAIPSVMVVGHNPTLQELALRLAGSGKDLERLKERFPTGALATLSVPGTWEDLGTGEAQLVDLVFPRDLER
jgi:phosphohistidine phosphatase